MLICVRALHNLCILFCFKVQIDIHLISEGLRKLFMVLPLNMLLSCFGLWVGDNDSRNLVVLSVNFTST
jgi:hypothetical protein